MTKFHVIADETLGGIKREYEAISEGSGIGVTSIKPTDIVIIDNKRYKLVDRKADVGERVLVIEAHESLPIKNVGVIVEITETDSDTCDGMFHEHDLADFEGGPCAVYHFQYRVLEPVANEASPETNDDIIANLVRRVAELERELGGYKALGIRNHLVRGNTELYSEIDGIKRDVETWAQEVEVLKHAQKPQQITIDADVFARLLGGDARD